MSTLLRFVLSPLVWVILTSSPSLTDGFHGWGYKGVPRVTGVAKKILFHVFICFAHDYDDLV